MKKRLALTKDGRMTYCTASEENVGKGRCNHIAHQRLDESTKEFCERIKDMKENNNKKCDNNKNNYIKNLDLEEKIELIDSENINDEILDILVKDKDWNIRVAVAYKGRDKYLDILINDEDEYVRKAVAAYGRDKDLDVLVNDEDWHVRRTVAEHGRDKDLDILANDKNQYVRAAVARCGRYKDLDILVNDEDYWVRYAVAEHGRDKDLDILVNDKNQYVRAAVAKCSRDKDLNILLKDKDWHVRAAVAECGRNKDLNILINDKNNYVRNIVVLNENFKYDKRLEDYTGRLEMIKEGCSEKEMNIIRNDPNKSDKIKLALIEKGIDVEKFLTDRNEEVQKAAFKKTIK